MVGGYVMMESSTYSEESELAEGYPTGQTCDVEPIGFERLGQVPNDLSLSGGAPGNGAERTGR
jgi:hypothetical protein